MAHGVVLVIGMVLGVRYKDQVQVTQLDGIGQFQEWASTGWDGAEVQVQARLYPANAGCPATSPPVTSAAFSAAAFPDPAVPLVLGLWAAGPRERWQTSSDPAALLVAGLWTAGPRKQEQTSSDPAAPLVPGPVGGPNARPSGPSGHRHVAKKKEIEKKIDTKKIDTKKNRHSVSAHCPALEDWK